MLLSTPAQYHWVYLHIILLSVYEVKTAFSKELWNISLDSKYTGSLNHKHAYLNQE